MTTYNIDYGTPTQAFPTVTKYIDDPQPEKPVVELTQEQKDAAQQSHWLMLNKALKEQIAHDPQGLRVGYIQRELDAMTSSGFIYKPKVEPEKPKVVLQAPLKVWEPSTERERLGVKELVICEICGERIPEGVARHKMETGFWCVLDAVRARRSGMSAELIQESLERQARARGEEPSAPVVEPEPVVSQHTIAASKRRKK